MAEQHPDATIVDPTAVIDATQGELPSVAVEREVLVLAWSEAQARGPEVLPIPRGGLTLGRGMTGFAGGPLLDPRMSREHSEIRRDRGRWIVTDLGSRNGTRLDGRKLEGSAALEPGTVLRLGSSLFVYSVYRERKRAVPVDRQLVGSSSAMEMVREAIAAVAPHDTSVLLCGETGTGKEVVAGALHRASGRAGAFVAVNCGAVSEGVLESELFGHRKGAFTGATADKRGLFEAADGGTILLDEFGEMPEALQVKLLRVLESRAVRPVGANTERPIDARVVAATNRDLVGDVRDGRFRSDLYARLAQWPIDLPPLKDRREDVPELARTMLERRGEGHRRIGLKLLEALMVHSWPLNVRGLANVMGAAVIAAGDDDELAMTPRIEDMLAAERARAEPPDEMISLQSTVPSTYALNRPAPTPESEHVLAALKESKGSVAAAARALGASRQQLYRIVEAEGWDLASFRD